MAQIINKFLAPGIDAEKIADGSVSNAEFERLNGLSGNIQDQLGEQIGVANGVASLDSNGRIPAAQLPETVLEYKGAWNPSTNTPALEDGVGTLGDLYRVSADYNPVITDLDDPSMINFKVGDVVTYNGTVWQKTPAADFSFDVSTLEVNTLANSGLAGGGDLSAPRNLSVDPGNATLELAVDGSEEILMKQGSNLRKITLDGISDYVAGPYRLANVSDFTLTSTDISNGYVDLDRIALLDMFDLRVRGAGVMMINLDYEVSMQGGSGGKTRITFLTPLSNELEAGDIIQAVYFWQPGSDV